MIRNICKAEKQHSGMTPSMYICDKNTSNKKLRGERNHATHGGMLHTDKSLKD